MTEHLGDSRPMDAHRVFEGLAPTIDRSTLERARSPIGPKHTVPILLVGSLAAMSLNLSGPLEPVDARDSARGDRPTQGAPGTRAALSMSSATPRNETPPAEATQTALAQPAVAASPAPPTYTVAAGDTVSDIAGKFGLATASVLAMNGLSWSSLIFPGQELKLSTGAPLPTLPSEPEAPARYTIVPGDTISAIAARHGISAQAILTANGLSGTSIIYPGQTIAIPDLGSALPVIDAVPVSNVQDAAPAPVSGASYTVVAGDTLSGIAARHGVDTQALLEANNLRVDSLIFTGDTLTLPGGTAPAEVGSSSSLTSEMRSNAAVIVQVGRDLGVSDYGIVIALATAMQESTLRNLTWGDRDSVGLFQQRPSSGWGSVDQLTTPVHAARLFYGGSSNPNAGFTRGLLDIPGWESMPLTVAAQAVQISAYPNAYAKWESAAWNWLAELS